MHYSWLFNGPRINFAPRVFEVCERAFGLPATLVPSIKPLNEEDIKGSTEVTDKRNLRRGDLHWRECIMAAARRKNGSGLVTIGLLSRGFVPRKRPPIAIELEPRVH